jgi:hypothetical protein
MHRITSCRTARARLALLPLMVVHRPWHISRATNLILGWRNASSGKEERCCGRRAQREVEGAVGADCDACRDWGTGVVVCCAGVEFLYHCEYCEMERMLVGKSYFAEIHALHSLTTQRGTDGWRGGGLACADYQFDDLVLLYRFLCHCVCIWCCRVATMESFGGPQRRAERSFSGLMSK